MAMLTADAALKLYPRGLWVFDATGRRLTHVMACDPETGEVVRWPQGAWSPQDWIRGQLRRIRPRLQWDWIYGGALHKRHGFWPAPLRVVPKDPWPGGRVPDGQAYIVGNGEREAQL